jgi:hypothetical protein
MGYGAPSSGGLQAANPDLSQLNHKDSTMTAYTKVSFRTGTPKQPGWYNASVKRKPDPDLFRWWDGEKWSTGVRSNKSAVAAGRLARKATDNSAHKMKWRPAPARAA